MKLLLRKAINTKGFAKIDKQYSNDINLNELANKLNDYKQMFEQMSDQEFISQVQERS